MYKKLIENVIDKRFGVEQKLIVVAARYVKNNSLALLLEEPDGTQYTTASVNLKVQPPAGSVFIKNYGEGEGMVDLLLDAGVIEPHVVCSCSTGFVNINAYRLSQSVLSQVVGI